MAMFIVDRASALAKPFDGPGTYSVEIVKTEKMMTPKGDNVVRLMFRSPSGHVVSDNMFNTEKSWWRVNQLLVACPGVTIPDGEQLDFTKSEVFDAFLGKFVGQKLQVKLEEETYVKNGETKKTLRVQRFLPEESPF
ncbi:MAG: hypothetical protein ACO329_11580 [Steroidobacteraceae bacterium]